MPKILARRPFGRLALFMYMEQIYTESCVLLLPVMGVLPVAVS